MKGSRNETCKIPFRRFGTRPQQLAIAPLATFLHFIPSPRRLIQLITSHLAARSSPHPAACMYIYKSPTCFRPPSFIFFSLRAAFTLFINRARLPPLIPSPVAFICNVLGILRAAEAFFIFLFSPSRFMTVLHICLLLLVPSLHTIPQVSRTFAASTAVNLAVNGRFWALAVSVSKPQIRGASKVHIKTNLGLFVCIYFSMKQENGDTKTSRSEEYILFCSFPYNII